MSSIAKLFAIVLFPHLGSAVYNGYKPASASEVPYAAGFIMNLDTSSVSDCQNADASDVMGSFCSGGLISEGVFVTAGHCFENEDTKASDGSLDVGALRVGLGMRYPYRDDDGSCSGALRGANEGMYKVKAVFTHKMYEAVGANYKYDNSKTGNSPEGQLALDHVDIAVVFLEDCATPVTGANKPRYGRIAGGNFSELPRMWADFGSKTNTGGLPASFWGYGESEDDAITLDANGKTVPKQVQRANWNFLRASSPPTVAGGKTWANCDWLPDSTASWSMQLGTAKAYASPGGDGNFKGAVMANPIWACTPRNPNDRTILSTCEQQTSAPTCTQRKTTGSGKAYCKWTAGKCAIDPDVGFGIGLVTYPSTGGGDSGSAAWYVENADKLTLQDRDQLSLVHVGIASAAPPFFPHWDQVIRTDYFQNWLATVIDRDSCAQQETKAYFVGFDATIVGGSSTSPPATQSGWDLNKHFVGTIKGVQGAQSLAKLVKRSNAGNWVQSSAAADSSGSDQSGGGADRELSPGTRPGVAWTIVGAGLLVSWFVYR